MRRSFTFGLVIGAALAFAPACVVTPRQCNANTCSGCCDGSGACQTGTSNAACGTAGGACTSCAGSFVCSLGQCQPTNTGGGAGGGSGGGTGGGLGGGGGSTAQPGNITFLWTLNGGACAQHTEVASVTVTIPGQTLANGGVYPCSTSGADGITLTNFAAGAYTYTVEAKSAASTPLFRATGSTTVNGDVTVNVDLAPVAGAPGAVQVSWTFPPNGASTTPTCAQAGVATVALGVDGATPADQPCSAGAGGNSVLLQNLTAGVHSIELYGRDTNAFTYYRKASTFTIVGGTTASAAYGFDWAVGSLPLKWVLNDGTFDLTCAQAGVSQVRIDLQDSAGNYVYGSNGVVVPCEAAGTQGTLFQYLTADTYRVYLQATTGVTNYESNLTTPPSIAVTAGAFPVVDGSTASITLVRQ